MKKSSLALVLILFVFTTAAEAAVTVTASSRDPKINAHTAARGSIHVY